MAHGPAIQRLLENLLVTCPGSIEAGIDQEIFYIADELSRQYLQITAPVPGTSKETWLPTEAWELYYTLLVDGVKARMFAQPGKPYSNPQLAAYFQQRYEAAAARARDDAGTLTGDTSLTDRLMDTLRMSLPGAKDSVIRTELFNTLDDLCREASIWEEVISVPLIDGVFTYSITPTGADIVRITSLIHESMNVDEMVYEFGVLAVPEFTDDDADFPIYASTVLAPSLLVTADAESWIPSDLWSKHYQTLIHGTLGRMMLQIGKPYSNPLIAKVHWNAFTSKKGAARHDMDIGGVYGGQRWRFPRYAR